MLLFYIRNLVNAFVCSALLHSRLTLSQSTHAKVFIHWFGVFVWLMWECAGNGSLWIITVCILYTNCTVSEHNVYVLSVCQSQTTEQTSTKFNIRVSTLEVVWSVLLWFHRPYVQNVSDIFMDYTIKSKQKSPDKHGSDIDSVQTKPALKLP